MDRSATIHVLPFEHQMSAVERFRDHLDHESVREQSILVYGDITNDLYVIRASVVQACKVLEAAGHGSEEWSGTLGAIDDLTAIVNRLYSVAVPNAFSPRSADCSS